MNVEEIGKVAVFGAGTMGPGLALVFARGGHEVALYSRKAETLEKAVGTARSSLDTLVGHGSITLVDADTALSRIHPTRSVEEAAGNADFVMETIAESKEAKTQLYTELDVFAKKDAIIVSNTSSLNIFELMPERRLPHTVIAHFFAPAHIIPLAEVVPAPQTSRETLSVTLSFLEELGKKPVVMKKMGPGFIVNRIQRAIGETCMDMVQEGLVDPEEIDRAIKLTLGIRLPIVGVMQTLDFQGLDMLLAYQKNVDKVYSFVEEMVNAGDLGVKTSRGIYDYEGRSEAEILRKRDLLYLKMLDYLEAIDAFRPV
ncbi:MAG: 3-hydroxyacyl-CoA dehydrogenase family protein [Actinobacteria bacterium]|nr:3-hydroxyacyl-CoA dehydrogenase family protein [Actinomycetota bacterium]